MEGGLPVNKNDCFTSRRRILHQECDPFYIHTSIQSRNALSMRVIWSGGRGARVCNLHIVLKPERMCSYVLLREREREGETEACDSHGREKA